MSADHQTRKAGVGMGIGNYAGFASSASGGLIKAEELARGEGEWRNIQLCIRRAFMEQNDTIVRQQDQLNAMMSTINLLREEMAHKTDRSAVVDILDHRQRADAHTHKYAKRKDVDSLKQTVAEISADLERKPTRNYVDESLKRKVDKSESLAAFLKTNKDLQMPLIAQLTEVRAQLSVQSSQLTNVADTQQRVCANRDEVNVLRTQVDHLFSLNAELPTREYIATMVDAKVGEIIFLQVLVVVRQRLYQISKDEVDVLLYNKLDKHLLTTVSRGNISW
jgi:hypothetical protein